MARTLTPSGQLQADLDLVRSLVRSWGDIDEGSAEQARAILNSGQVLQNLLGSANEVYQNSLQPSPFEVVGAVVVEETCCFNRCNGDINHSTDCPMREA